MSISVSHGNFRTGLTLSSPQATERRSLLAQAGGQWSSERPVTEYHDVFEQTVSNAHQVGARAVKRLWAFTKQAVTTAASTLVPGPAGAAIGEALLTGESKLRRANQLLEQPLQALGRGLGSLAHRMGIPLKQSLVDVSRGQTQLIETKPELSAEEIQGFASELKPGDVILTRQELSPVNLPTYLATRSSNFSHAMFYAGDNIVIDTTAQGVQEKPIQEALQNKQHVIGLRPDYETGQAERAVESAQAKLGAKYDFRFNPTNDSLYCSEAVYEVLKESAPQVDIEVTRKLRQDLVIPDKIFDSPQLQPVAELGHHRSLFDRLAYRIAGQKDC